LVFPVHSTKFSMWKSQLLPGAMNFKRDCSKGKVILEVFCDWRSIRHHESIPEGAMINKKRCSHIYGRQFTWSIQKCGQPNLGYSRVTMQLVQKQLTIHGYHRASHSPYCLNLTLCNFYHFMDEGLSLQGCSGGSSCLQDCIAGGDTSWLPEMFWKLYKLWQKCVAA
jgi:hypothetical protein